MSRMSRGSYWMRVLFINIGMFLLYLMVNGSASLALPLVNLGVAVYCVVIGCARMHDVGKSGWYLLIPIYGLILTLSDGERGRNKYGSDPKRRNFNQLADTSIWFCSNCNAENTMYDKETCYKCNAEKD